MPGSAAPLDVLVVGGGPAGAAAGYWSATAGHRVTIVERAQFPRDKTCGDALSPRAVHELQDMGLGTHLERYHRYEGLRATGMGRQIELPWPEHPVFPNYGYVARRRDLDREVLQHAERAGAAVLEGHEAIDPIMERGFVRGAVVKCRETGVGQEIRARYVIVADGANSRFGRALGTFRRRDWPYATAIRSYWASPKHDDIWIESALGIEDRNGNPLPGYGWVFPVGDGTVNVGVGLLSTYRDFKSINTSQLLEVYAAAIRDRWEIDPDLPTQKAAAGKIPMGGSVGPKTGPTFLVVGDAAGSVNPFNGDGIDYALETGRLAAEVLHQALGTDDALALQQYPKLLEANYGQYFKVARLFTRIIGRPVIMRELTRTGMHSRTLMEWVLRIMSNMLRPDEFGPAEAAYKAAAALARFAPDT